MPQLIHQCFLGPAAILAMLSAGCEYSPTVAQSPTPATVPAPPEATPLEEFARALGDPRSDQQIRRDNAFIDAVRDRDLANAAKMLKGGADPSVQ